MGDLTRAFYEGLAESYHLMFQDWSKSIEWQASVLGPLIEGEVARPVLRILDCACGIGTQTLGLASRGHLLTGSDLSEAAIARAGREAERRRLSIRYEVADMRDLSTIAESDFDVVIAADNALPHLLMEQDLAQALGQIASKLRPGGLFLATTRDYDELVLAKPTTQPAAFFEDGEFRRIYHQVWDWTGDRQYMLHLYITQETSGGWDCRHFVSAYRALLREELTAHLREAGFAGVRWLMPADSGFYQPLVKGHLET